MKSTQKAVNTLCVICAVTFLMSFAPDSWAKDKTLSGTVVVEKELRVGGGDTLRVLPGARLLFKEGASLSVEGELSAEGGPAGQISFAPVKAGVRWPGVKVSKGGSLRLTGVSLMGAQEAIRVTDGRLYLRSVSITGCEKGVTLEMMSEAEVVGLKAADIIKTAFTVRQDSRAAIRDCAFSGPGGTGLSVTGKNTVAVTGSVFDGQDCGIRATYPGASPEVRECAFTANKYGVFTEYPDASPKLVRCRFTKNTYGVYSKRLSAPAVEGCEVSGNEYGLYATEGSSLTAKGSRITKNKYGVYVTFSSYPKVNGCDLSGNSGYAAYLDEQSYDWVSANGDAQRRQQMGMRAMAAGQGGSKNRRQGMEAARYVNPKGGFVDFGGNYWGVEALGEMRAASGLTRVGSIYDYFDKDTDVYDGKTFVRDKADYSGYLAESPYH